MKTVEEVKEWLSQPFILWIIIGMLIISCSVSDYRDFSDKATQQLRQYKYISIDGTDYTTDSITQISMRHYGTFRLEMTDGTIVYCDQYAFTDYLHN